MIRVGTAGWQIPRASAEAFPTEGSTLERYAARFSAVEINSSFYKPHRTAAWERWAASAPEGFQFAVKAPKAITHDGRLAEPETALDAFVAEIDLLRDKLGPVLVQLPPSLIFDAEVAGAFFRALRQRHAGLAACEPRHPSWFTAEADALLVEHQIARVAADPAKVPETAEPGGWRGLTYFRLHGSPHMYVTPYSTDYLADLATRLRTTATAWCMFDNTMSGAAAANALELQRLILAS